MGERQRVLHPCIGPLQLCPCQVLHQAGGVGGSVDRRIVNHHLKWASFTRRPPRSKLGSNTKAHPDCFLNLLRNLCISSDPQALQKKEHGYVILGIGMGACVRQGHHVIIS